MSGERVELKPEAERELDDAFEWYLERSIPVAEAFIREAGNALIASAPTIWPRFEVGTRRYVMRNFPYSVIHLDRPTKILVLAVAHQKRRPRYWISRLRRDPAN